MRRVAILCVVLSSCGDNEPSEDRTPVFRQVEDSEGTEWISAALVYPFGLFSVKGAGTMSHWNYDLTESSLQFAGDTAGDDWITVDGSVGTLTCQQRDGTLWSWGPNDPERMSGCLAKVEDGPWSVVSGPCRIDVIGRLWCNSDTGLGQLGVEEDWQTVSASAVGAICAIKVDGTLWCWGDNQHGEVGDGTTEQRTVPVRVGGDAVWQDVATRTHHTCAVQPDGTLWCWGANARVGLGNDAPGFQTTPKPLGGDQWMKILDAYCALRQDESLWCWGDEWGTRPTRVPTGAGMTSLVHDGGNVVCGVKADASLWCATLRVNGFF